MKLPISWLREYIDIDDLTVQELADRMTFAGIEIEGIETVGGVPEKLVVGEVRVCESVPESDHLHKCRVFDGTQELDVMCGAPNCRAGRFRRVSRHSIPPPAAEVQCFLCHRRRPAI